LLDPDSQTLSWVGLVNALALLLGASAAMAEAALAGLSRARLHRLVEQGLHRYRVLLPFVEHPSRYQTALVLLRVAAVVLATALVAGVLSNGLFLLTLVFFFALAETVPRRLVTGRAEEVALAAAVPLLVCATLLGPFIRLLELARGASRLSGPAPNGRNGEVREEAADGPVVVTVGEEQHVVAEEEGEMIHSIVELEEKTVRQIMVPRTDIIALPATATLLEAIDRVIAHGYSRLPVYEGTVDNIIGILYAKDLFRAVRSGQTGESVRHFLRPAYFIPESKRVDELLHEMQQKRIHIAIVVDEYGGTAGLVTIEDLLGEIRKRVAKGHRVLVTTLTKRMAEDLTEYLREHGVKVRYLHSDIDTLERMEIVRDLRLGVFDVLVGINLLREGLDLPEVSLVAILDADKEGYLRSETALIQMIGRAARNAEGKVIMYADRITESMRRAIEETYRRRRIQEEYNRRHGIVPRTVVKPVHDVLEATRVAEKPADYLAGKSLKDIQRRQIPELIKKLQKEMREAARALEFERAAVLRDMIFELEERLRSAAPQRAAAGG